MKKYLLIALVLLYAIPTLNAQKKRNFRGNSKKDFFGGARDLRNITKYGLQISFGPSYTLSFKEQTFSGSDATGRPLTSTLNPAGRLGGYLDIGLAHYRFKPSKFLESYNKKHEKSFSARHIGSNLIHRIDWGLGFHYLGGKETIENEYFNASGQLIGNQVGENKFYNGYATARFTADRFLKLNDAWHLEYGLGVNALYNVLPGNQNTLSYLPTKYQRNFMMQLHTHIGFNYQIKRGSYFIIGLFSPVIGVYEPNKLRPTVQWFSSNYYPLQPQFKWIYHFTKNSKGCNTGSEEDKKRNKEYMQNR
jgi:hypothetical protein